MEVDSHSYYQLMGSTATEAIKGLMGKQGWVLEGIPQTREEALSLQEAGVAPNHVVLLEAPDAVLIERSQGKRIDPVTGGKSLQAKLISQKYNIVNLCCGELLEAVSADATNMGELIKPYLESGQQVPDSMVLQILTERLSRLDCTTRGWVLHGFPRDLEQAEKLQESNFIPSSAACCVALSTSKDVSKYCKVSRKLSGKTGVGT
ncbi:unnamed protein product [Coregonus sp. 'balchen']|nr:unnamed protein product [Coregonus sp. 'balchen']